MYLVYEDKETLKEFLYICWARREESSFKNSLHTYICTGLLVTEEEKQAFDNITSSTGYWMMSSSPEVLRRDTMDILHTCNQACEDSIFNLKRLTSKQNIRMLADLEILQMHLHSLLNTVTCGNFLRVMMMLNSSKIPSLSRFKLNTKTVLNTLAKEQKRLNEYMGSIPVKKVKEPLWNRINVFYSMKDSDWDTLEPVFELVAERNYQEFIKKAYKLGIQFPIIDVLDLI